MTRKLIIIFLGLLVMIGSCIIGNYFYQRYHVRSFYDQADKAFQRNNYQQALTLYQSVLLFGHKNMSLPSSEWAEICSRLAYAYYKVNPNGDGSECLKEILPLYNTFSFKDTIVRGYIYFGLGRFAFNQKKWVKSSYNHKNAIKNLTQLFMQSILDKHLSEPLLCNSYRELLSCYFELKQYSEAQKLIPAIEDLHIENLKFPEWAGVYSGITANMLESGNLSYAKTYCFQGLKICSSLPETPELRAIEGTLKWLHAKIFYKEKMLSHAVNAGKQAHEILKNGTYNYYSPEILKTLANWERELASSHK